MPFSIKEPRRLPRILISVGFLLFGMLFYAWYKEMIVVRIPTKKSIAPVQKDITERKKTKLIYYHQGKFKSEEKELLHEPLNIRATVNSIITGWLTLLDEEELWPKKVSLQSSLIDSSGTNVLLSFDQSPFAEESTLAKLMWVEGILKTLSQSGLPIKSVQLLVQNKPLQDANIDFNNPWPISGYSHSF